jgi:phosphoenolpyruvate carboxylase
VTEEKDIHNYEGRLNAYLRRLEKENFSQDDRNLISGYIQQCRAQVTPVLHAHPTSAS